MRRSLLSEAGILDIGIEQKMQVLQFSRSIVPFLIHLLQVVRFLWVICIYSCEAVKLYSSEMVRAKHVLTLLPHLHYIHHLDCLLP